MIISVAFYRRWHRDKSADTVQVTIEMKWPFVNRKKSHKFRTAYLYLTMAHCSGQGHTHFNWEYLGGHTHLYFKYLGNDDRETLQLPSNRTYYTDYRVTYLTVARSRSRSCTFLLPISRKLVVFHRLSTFSRPVPAIFCILSLIIPQSYKYWLPIFLW